MSKLSDRRILAILLVGLLLSWLGSTIATKRENSANALTEAGVPDGYRYFFQFKNKLEQHSATRWRRPILKAGDLKSFQSYFLIAPKRPLSAHEGKALIDWVKAGGNLVVSFEDAAVIKRLQAWSVENGIKLPNADEFKEFQNGTATEVESAGASRFSAADEKYSFYSYLRFQDAQCASYRESCYIREISVGAGSVVVFAGITPFANAMIERGDNAKLAARLAYWSKNAAFDEFHQFLTEKTLTDMLMDTKISLPLMGFLIMTLFYFLFGSVDLADPVLRKVRHRALTTYQALGTEVVRRAITASPTGMSNASRWHAAVLGRLLRFERGRIDEIENSNKKSNGQALAVALIRFHKNWLTVRGKK
jgi:hypothetical protein